METFAFFMKFIFWLCTAVVLYVYLGYPAVLLLLSLFRKENAKGEITPYVTLFIPAYNEEKVIREKILNSLSLDYPKDRLEIAVASDGSTDGTGKIANEYAEQGVILFESPARRGKNAVINEFSGRCRGEIIIYTDANAFYREDAVRNLVKNFSEKMVGCVVGHLKYGGAVTTTGRGEGLYFRYESVLKELESLQGCVVTANGSIFGIRKSLFSTIDPAVPNDFAHPIQIAGLGYKVVFEKDAVANEKATESIAEEFRRRSRIVTRSFTAFMLYRKRFHMLSGMKGFCFVSHKLIRWFVPVCLIAIFSSSLFLSGRLYRAALLVQCLFYVLAFIGIFLRERKGMLLTVPFYFIMINFAAMHGIGRYLTGKRQVLWEAAGTTR